MLLVASRLGFDKFAMETGGSASPGERRDFLLTKVE